MGGKQKLTTTMLRSQGISIPPERGGGGTNNQCLSLEDGENRGRRSLNVRQTVGEQSS